SSLQTPAPAAVSPPAAPAIATTAAMPDESIPSQTVLADLQRKIEEARADNRALREKLVSSDQHAVEVETRLRDAEKKNSAQGLEVIQARNDLNGTRNELLQAKESVSASQATIQSLQYKLADREARLAEVSASVERE